MTDIEGSTSLWQADAQRTRGAVERHDFLVSSAVGSCRGSLVKARGEGDSHFAVFERAIDAAHAAVSLQKALSEEPWPTRCPIRVRIALHSADAHSVQGDYYGTPVNRCARIRGAGHGGQVLVSNATQELIAGMLGPGERLKDLGVHRLKDLLVPERIYQLVSDGLPEEFPPLRSLDPVRHNLPVQLTSFVGREAEVRQIKRLLFQHRLLTLTGAGGCGKTRLALQVAAEAADEFADGAWFVELVSLADGAFVAQAVASALHVGDRGADPITPIVERFRESSALLFLDNCEHIGKEVAAFVHQLLRACPNLTVLATSRHRLGVHGECTRTVKPLDTGPKHMEGYEAISQIEAVRLFRERAGSRTDREVLTEATADSILSLCRRLDGIPLALEQAAAAITLMSPAQMLSRLEQQLELLELEEEGLDPRHRTMRAALDWSYELLDAAERDLFKGLSVFAGGFTLEACEAVFGSATIDTLHKLAAKSLVTADYAETGQARFRLLQPLRDYASEKLGGLSAETHKRHLEYFLGLADRLHKELVRTESGEILLKFEADHDNFRAALRWSVSEAPCESLRLSILLHRFWMGRGHLREAMEWLEKGLDRGKACPEEVRADALNIFGIYHIFQGSFERARILISESRTLWEGLGRMDKAAQTLNNLGTISAHLGEVESARTFWMDAIRMDEDLGRIDLAATIRANLAQLEMAQGDPTRAVPMLEEALKNRDALSDRWSMALLTDLSNAHLCRGELEEAIERARESLALWRSVRDEFLGAQMLLNATAIALQLGNVELACGLLGAAETAVDTMGVAYPPAEQKSLNASHERAQNECRAEEYSRWCAHGRSWSIADGLARAEEALGARALSSVRKGTRSPRRSRPRARPSLTRP